MWVQTVAFRWRSNSSVISTKLISISAEMACPEVSTVLSRMFAPNDAIFAQYQIVILSRICFLNIREMEYFVEGAKWKTDINKQQKGWMYLIFLLFRQPDLHGVNTYIPNLLIKPPVGQQYKGSDYHYQVIKCQLFKNLTHEMLNKVFIPQTQSQLIINYRHFLPFIASFKATVNS